MVREVPFKRIGLQTRIKDIARIKKITNERQNGTLLYLTISGSDLYGFSSKDSDIDYRGCYATDPNSFLCLKHNRDLIEAKPDIVLFELEKEIDLALKSNCNVIEHITAPKIYVTPQFKELRELLEQAIGKSGIFHSYRGMAVSNYEKFIAKGRKVTYKKYLYIFRALLACLHFLHTGVIQPNINKLNAYFKIPEVKMAVKAKKEGAEMEEVQGEIDSGAWEVVIVDLIDRVNNAYNDCDVQSSYTDEQFEEINSWLLNYRIEHLKRNNTL